MKSMSSRKENSFSLTHEWRIERASLPLTKNFERDVFDDFKEKYFITDAFNK